MIDVIDFPNLIAGFILGLVPLGFERWNARRVRRRTARTEWIAAARELEPLVWRKDLTTAELTAASRALPLDRWRADAGPDGFRELEAFEGTLGVLEAMEDARAAVPFSAVQWKAAYDALTSARVAFANWSRRASSAEYNAIIQRESQTELRRNMLRHPWRTVRLVRRNTKARRGSATPRDGR